MKTKIQSEITVDMTVRVSVDSVWSEEATLKQVHRDAKESAERTIKKALAGKVVVLDGKTVNVFSKEVKNNY